MEDFITVLQQLEQSVSSTWLPTLEDRTPVTDSNNSNNNPFASIVVVEHKEQSYPIDDILEECTQYVDKLGVRSQDTTLHVCIICVRLLLYLQKKKKKKKKNGRSSLFQWTQGDIRRGLVDKLEQAKQALHNLLMEQDRSKHGQTYIQWLQPCRTKVEELEHVCRAARVAWGNATQVQKRDENDSSETSLP